MKRISENLEIERAREHMKAFAWRSGLAGDGCDRRRRYLWTDALAAQTLFSLAEAYRDPDYTTVAVKLIDLVHLVLGRHRVDDERTGWISGLSEEEGQRRPTAGGLRIGKALPERGEGEPLHERLEWDRDGQYFHYLTRWMLALLRAAESSGERPYAEWAADLAAAGARFVEKRGNQLRLYCKMNTDLSRPSVSSQGAQDPLEGLLCVEAARLAARREGDPVLERFANDLARLCSGRTWSTTDPLGTGGLLLHLVWAGELEARG